MNAHTEIVPHTAVERICKCRDLALKQQREAALALSAAYDLSDKATGLKRQADMGEGGHYHDDGSAFGHLFRPRGFDVEKSMESYRKSLDCGIWRYLIERAGMTDLMDAQAKKEFSESLGADVPEATLDNVRATLQQLFADADMIFQRGLVNCFSKLDRRFKSHDGFKVGSRIIVERAFSEHSGSTEYGSTWDTIADVERVMAKLDSENPEGAASLRKAVDDDRRGHYGPMQSQTETEYFRIDGFKNRNAHLWFTRDDLVEKANKLLAEYYGEVLPDAYQGGDDEDLFNKSTAVSKDLQFYPSPSHVVREVLDNLHLSEGAKVLEPSAGQGAIALEAARKGARVTAYEVVNEHCDVMKGAAQREGLDVTVRQANFLSIEPTPIYDFVCMNPPFYGTHYMDHIRHAFKFLAPGGLLRAVVPTSASVNETKKHLAFRKWAKPLNSWGWAGPFKDLPEGSFAASGTRINTCLLMICNR